MEIIGKLDNFSIEWAIQKFSSLSGEDDNAYKSQIFTFNGESWCLSLNPNSIIDENPVRNVDLFLVRISPGPPIGVDFTFSILKCDGEIVMDGDLSHVFKDGVNGCGTSFISRSELFERKSELLPADVLTVKCSIKYSKSTENASGTSTECCCHCNATFSTESISWHKKKCMDRKIECPDCLEAVVLKDWLYDHKCHVQRIEAVKKHFEDLSDMMECGNYSDVTIKVKEEEFHLHKNILGARSPYFNAMFSSNMRENISGFVSIDDCEPEIFRSFIHFLYTGKLDYLSPERVCPFYEVSDKYQENTLKEECLQFMMNNLSVESFCYFVILALKYEKKELLETTTKFFASKREEIIHSKKWHAFLKEYPDYANELSIKSLDM